jgi:uncharacterized membrane protein YdjX (TVP38/TMEM64 family)
VGLLLLLASIGPAVGGVFLLGTVHALAPWLRGHAHANLTGFIAIAAALTGMALMPTYALSVLAGWVYGRVLGFLAILTAHTAAAALAAAATRGISGDRIIRLIDQHPRWGQIRRGLMGAGFWKSLLIVTLVRLPSSPFALTNVMLAAVRVPWGVYLWGTVIGLFPRTLIEVVIGAQVRTLNFHSHRLAAHALLSAATGILALIVIGIVADHTLRRVTH